MVHLKAVCVRQNQVKYYDRSAVYAATKAAREARVNEVKGRIKIHVLMPDLEARGLGDRVIDGVTPVDYAGFVDLVAGNKNCQSWL
jgi:tRNA 2-thiouridine synthesizing protein B